MEEFKAVADQLQRRLTVRVPLFHLAGIATVFVYLSLTLGPPDDAGNYSVLHDLMILGLVIAVSFPLGMWVSKRRGHQITGWLEEARAPTPDERRAVLAEPLHEARMGFAFWVVAALVYPAYILLVTDHSIAHSARVTVGILLGGMTTSALCYLMLEREYRPAFAMVLAGQPLEQRSRYGVRDRLLTAWAVGSGVPLLAITLAPWMHESFARVPISTSVVVMALIGLAAGVAATLLAARTVVDPMERVVDALRRVRDGDLSVRMAVDDGGEIGVLESSVNVLADGLRERERLHDLFGRHVGQEVARRALEQGTGLVSEHRDATAMFVDLVGSSAMAEALPAGEVVDVLNRFFATVISTVTAEGGWVNKFEGDGALCIFGAPDLQPDHAARALRAARRLHDELGRGELSVKAAIGVSSGEVVAGNVGTESRYEYTVIGRPVNQAARLCDLAKERPVPVLAGAAAVEAAGPEASHWRSVGHLALRGIAAPVAVFEPSALVSHA